MTRERIAWLFSLVLITVVAFRSPSAAQRDSDYRFVRTLVDIQRLVAGNYVDKVDVDKLEQAAIDGMLNQLDPYTNYVPPAKREEFDRMLEGTFRGVGVQLNQATPNGPIEVVTPIDGSPAFKAGVMAGDVILKVNGESIEGQRLQDVIKKIGGDAGSDVRLTVKRETGETLELRMKRQEVIVPTIKGFQRNLDNTWDWFVVDQPKIAYMRITQFTPSTFRDVKAILDELIDQGMAGFILDLRWNPGGQLDQAVQVVDLFIKDGVIVSTRGDKRPERREVASAKDTLPWFPMIVIVNEHSASAAEIVAGSLMDNRRAAVLGERTYGKGSVQELIPLEGSNGELKLTVAYYYLPSGKLVHRKKDAQSWGVEPQIHVPIDEETQQRVMEERMSNERFRRAATRPATQNASPTTRPADTQLQRAIDTLILMTVLQNGEGPTPPNPATTSTTRPATSRTAPDHE